MKKIFLTLWIVILIGTATKACTCGGGIFDTPNTFCGTLNGNVLGWGGTPAFVVKAVKLQDINHGMSALIIGNLKGVISEDTIMLWGDPGNLCRTYTGFLNVGDTLILGMYKFDSTHIDPLELPGHYEFPGCGLYYLNVYNDTVYGQISADSNAMELGEFENYIVNNFYQTSCVPIYVGMNSNVNDEIDFAITPNPFSRQTTIKFPNSNFETLALSIFDIQGRLMRTIPNINSGEVVIDRGDLERGLYVIQLDSDNGPRGSGKLVVE